MNLKNLFENGTIEVDDFNMANLYDSVWQELENNIKDKNNVKILKEKFGSDYKKLGYALIRNIFLIELVKVPKIETTKFRVRWYEQLKNDQRYCSLDECMEIFTKLYSSLPNWINDSKNLLSITMSFSNSIIPYEIPIDYLKRSTSENRIHTVNNINWYCDELYLRTLKLRKYLTEDSTSPDKSFFKTVLTDKIKVKTYLTDRVLTGDHKTNREKRWEAHPESVHFAERRTCIGIEYALVTQICSFENFPSETLKILRTDGIISVAGNDNSPPIGQIG